MKLIAGLGNPGPQYHNTRHNIGFLGLDTLASAFSPEQKFENNKKLHAEIIKTEQVILAKPQTFMNLSGRAIAAIATFYKILPQDIWIIHDEVDIELGRIKIQKGGGSAGHNGIKSIIEALGTAEFIRWRIGVDKPAAEENKDTADYVLEDFTQNEVRILPELGNKVQESVIYALKNDIIASMNKYN